MHFYKKQSSLWFISILLNVVYLEDWVSWLETRNIFQVIWFFCVLFCQTSDHCWTHFAIIFHRFYNYQIQMVESMPRKFLNERKITELCCISLMWFHWHRREYIYQSLSFRVCWTTELTVAIYWAKDFRLPNRTGHDETFYLIFSKTNTKLKSPFHVMCHNFTTELSCSCDITMSLSLDY